MPGLAVAAALSWCAMLALSLRQLRRLGLLDRLATAPCDDFAASARRVLRVGLPAAATNAIIPVATTLFTALLAAHGAVAVAGFSVGSRVEALAMVAFFALSAVANPYAAQNAGAGRMERVHAGMRAALLFCAGWGAALGLLLWFLSPFAAGLLTGDSAVAASAALYLSLMPWGFGAVGAIAVANAAFNGLERPLPALASCRWRAPWRSAFPPPGSAGGWQARPGPCSESCSPTWRWARPRRSGCCARRRRPPLATLPATRRETRRHAA